MVRQSGQSQADEQSQPFTRDEDFIFKLLQELYKIEKISLAFNHE